MPDPTIPSDETGTRHRTAERVAKQTGALVISISQQRETVTVFLGKRRYQLEPIADVLAKTNQALATLETYRAAARAGADAADGARVPERGRARRRARRPPARRADDADGRGDRARLRRARHRGAADPDAARGAASATCRARRPRSSTTTTSQGGADATRERRSQALARARLPGAARVRAARRAARLPARR